MLLWVIKRSVCELASVSEAENRKANMGLCTQNTVTFPDGIETWLVVWIGLYRRARITWNTPKRRLDSRISLSFSEAPTPAGNRIPMFGPLVRSRDNILSEITLKCILGKWWIELVDWKLRSYKSNWLRHVTRMNNSGMPEVTLNYRPNGWRRLGKLRSYVRAS